MANCFLLLATIKLIANGCEVDIDLLSLASKYPDPASTNNVILASRTASILPPMTLPSSDIYGDGTTAVPDDLDYFPDLATLSFTKARLKVCDGNGRYELKGKGFPRKAPVTIWQFYGNPFTGETAQYPIYSHVSGGGPLAPARAGFTNGRLKNGDPNVVPVDSNGDFHFLIELDYNPLEAYAAPLVNNKEGITQGAYCADDIVAAVGSAYCQHPYEDNSHRITIAYEYLREFDQATGMQLVDEDGNAVIARSPLPVGGLAFAAHIDLLSHGFLAGVEADEDCILNLLDSSGFNCNDHYGLAFFTSISD